MKRQTIGVLAGLAVAAAVVTADLTAQTAATTQQTKDVTVTGCLIQGSAPTVFILDKARVNPNNTQDPGLSYVVISKVEDVDLTTLLNHQVRMTGAAETKAMPADPKNERDLPRLTATAIVNVSDTCPAPAR